MGMVDTTIINNLLSNGSGHTITFFILLIFYKLASQLISKLEIHFDKGKFKFTLHVTEKIEKSAQKKEPPRNED